MRSEGVPDSLLSHIFSSVDFFRSKLMRSCFFHAFYFYKSRFWCFLFKAACSVFHSRFYFVSFFVCLLNSCSLLIGVALQFVSVIFTSILFFSIIICIIILFIFIIIYIIIFFSASLLNHVVFLWESRWWRREGVFCMTIRSILAFISSCSHLSKYSVSIPESLCLSVFKEEFYVAYRSILTSLAFANTLHLVSINLSHNSASTPESLSLCVFKEVFPVASRSTLFFPRFRKYFIWLSFSIFFFLTVKRPVLSFPMRDAPLEAFSECKAENILPGYFYRVAPVCLSYFTCICSVRSVLSYTIQIDNSIYLLVI